MGYKGNRKRDELTFSNLIPTIKSIVHDQIYINYLPSYGNTIFYSFGFLLLTCFALLVVTGLTMVFFGPLWWANNPVGVYIRSIHMWAAQAFVLFLFLHVFVVFSTSAFKKQKIPWVIGSIILFIAIIQVEFGYGLRGDFGTLYRVIAGQDFWNGNFLGFFVNVLNYGQLYGIHTVLVPAVLATLIAIHFLLVRKHGISKPYRKDIEYKIVEADHRMLFIRAGVAVIAILFIALVIPSPFVPPPTIRGIAQNNPYMIAQTLVQEFNHTSGTATYFDSIDPYTYDTRTVYVSGPYNDYLTIRGGTNMTNEFYLANATTQLRDINLAYDYFARNGSINISPASGDPLIPIVSAVVVMAQSGTYGPLLKEDLPGNNPTYYIRFLYDTGYINNEATALGLQLNQYGMVKDDAGNGIAPLNTWWMLPYNVMDNTILANDPNQDRDGGIILGILWLVFVTLPWLPYVNKIPDKLRLYRLFWKVKTKK